MTEGRLAPDEVRTRTFTRAVRGYKRREVRRLLERAATDLARLRNGVATDGPDDQLPLTPEEVEEARFQASLGGYEMDEVDEFLDQLVVELERAAHEPLRPPSALPAPPRPGLFPAAHGFRTAGPMEEAPGRDTEVPIARADEPAAALSMGPVAGPAAEPTAGREAEPADALDADLPADQRRLGARVEPPVVARQPPPAGPLPATHPRPGAGPLPAAQPPPAAPPAPAEPDEGFFPPPSVPPSAAPAPTPPPPPAQRPPPLSPARPLTPSEVETRSFDRGAPGYLPTHVDLFLAKAARALAGRDGETMNRWDVLRQRFPLGPRGYATSEVDAFLVRLAAQFPEPDQAAQEEILRKLQQQADGP
jgi:DivIVA domain-containing protein